jgi:hypothetical protein
MALRSVALVFLLVGVGCGDGATAPDAGGDGGGSDVPVLPDASIDVAADTAVDLTADAGSDSGADDGAAGDAAMCVGPIPGCTGPGDGLCDPICQSRCGCQQRCAISAGLAACVAPAATPIPVGERCTARADSCQAGAICLEETEAACGDRCFRFCRSDADCAGGAACHIEVQFGASATAFRVCGPPAELCDPTGAAACARADRPAPTFGCYVLSSELTDTAVCDCAGQLKLGDPCNFEHECLPGLECIRLAGAATCRQTCKLATPTTCPAGTACKPMGLPTKLSTLYGYCM